MLPAFHAYEMMLEEAKDRNGEWLFECQEIDRLSEVQAQFRATSPVTAIVSLGTFMNEYFNDRNVEPIADISADPPSIKIRSKEAADFLLQAKRLRGAKTIPDCKEFENLVASQLSKKLPGEIWNVGVPRKNRRVSYFRSEMARLGFNLSKARNIKDGGMDVLWALPLGKRNSTPLVILQCKNSERCGDNVHASVSEARKTFKKYRLDNSQGECLVIVVVNSFLDDSFVAKAEGREFAYVGLGELLPHSKLPTSLFTL